MIIDNAWTGSETFGDKYKQLEAENAQLKVELAQAKRSYDGAVAAHHETKNQYRDLIAAHIHELVGWEAARVALNRENEQLKVELARCRQGSLEQPHALRPVPSTASASTPSEQVRKEQP